MIHIKRFSPHFFWPRHMTCGILVPPTGIEPVLAVKALSPNPWTTREFPKCHPFNVLNSIHAGIYVFMDSLFCSIDLLCTSTKLLESFVKITHIMFFKLYILK